MMMTRRDAVAAFTLFAELLANAHADARTQGAPASPAAPLPPVRSEEHTSELQSLRHLVCRLLLEKKNKDNILSGVSRCIHHNARKKTTITSIKRQTIKI